MKGLAACLDGWLAGWLAGHLSRLHIICCKRKERGENGDRWTQSQLPQPTPHAYPYLPVCLHHIKYESIHNCIPVWSYINFPSFVFQDSLPCMESLMDKVKLVILWRHYVPGRPALLSEVKLFILFLTSFCVVTVFVLSWESVTCLHCINTSHVVTVNLYANIAPQSNQKVMQTYTNQKHGMHGIRYSVAPIMILPISADGIACWLERWTCHRKVASSNPGWSSGRIFFSRANFLCWLLFGVCSTPMLLTAACKRSQSFCQKCRWQVTPKNAYTFDPTSGLTMPISRHSVGTYEDTSSHATHQETLGHSCLSSLSHCELILA